MSDALNPYSCVKSVSFFSSGQVQGFTARPVKAPFRKPAICNLLR